MVQEDSLHTMDENEAARNRVNMQPGDMLQEGTKMGEKQPQTVHQKGFIDTAKEKLAEMEGQFEDAFKHTKETVGNAAHSFMDKFKGEQTTSATGTAEKKEPGAMDQHEKTADELGRERAQHGGDPLLSEVEKKAN